MIENYTPGLDEEEQAADNKALAKAAEKPKRAPFAIWNVGDESYKLKLTASDISALEQKYRRNLLMYLFEDDLPAISDMLTVIQASMRTFHHGMKYVDVQKLFDKFVEEGGDQTMLMSDVIMPLMSVSGFFTQSQAEDLTQKLKEADTTL